MKKSTTFRSIVAMTVIFFAVTATSCQKETEIAPTTPTAPVVPTTPAVSLKPTAIVTTENGISVRKQIYEYDAQGKLAKYVSLDRSLGLDSVLLRTNNVSFKTTESNNITESLVFNADKTFKSIFTANDQSDFVNNGTQLSRIQRIRQNNTPVSLAVFNYTNSNLSNIGAEIRIDINYHDNLPYQKGINEIPVVFKSLKYFKIMEMENATTMTIYNKLIKQVILNFGIRRELHDYTYTFDSNNRVIQIQDTQTIVTNTSSAQKVFISTITYAQN